jgi:hypothetical protein
VSESRDARARRRGGAPPEPAEAGAIFAGLSPRDRYGLIHAEVACLTLISYIDSPAIGLTPAGLPQFRGCFANWRGAPQSRRQLPR